MLSTIESSDGGRREQSVQHIEGSYLTMSWPALAGEKASCVSMPLEIKSRHLLSSLLAHYYTSHYDFLQSRNKLQATYTTTLAAMVAITKLLLLGAASFAAAFPLSPFKQSTATLISDINSLDSSVKGLTNSVKQYNGGFSSPLILPYFAAAHTFNRKAYLDAMQLTSINAADAQTLISVVHNGLSVDNPIAVEAVKAKRAQFTQSGLKGAILSSLELLLSDHKSLSAVIASKAPQDAASQAAIKVEVDLIADALQDGINYYS